MRRHDAGGKLQCGGATLENMHGYPMPTLRVPPDLDLNYVVDDYTDR